MKENWRVKQLVCWWWCSQIVGNLPTHSLTQFWSPRASWSQSETFKMSSQNGQGSLVFPSPLQFAALDLIYCSGFDPCSEGCIIHFFLGFPMALITIVSECFINISELLFSTPFWGTHVCRGETSSFCAFGSDGGWIAGGHTWQFYIPPKLVPRAGAPLAHWLLC